MSARTPRSLATAGVVTSIAKAEELLPLSFTVLEYIQGPYVRLKDFALTSAVFSSLVQSQFFLGWGSLPQEYSQQCLLLYL